MTNEAWLNTLSTEEKAKFLVKSCNFCSRDCIDKYSSERVCENGIAEWLKQSHQNPMTELKAGDYIFYEYSGVMYRAFCISSNLVYLIDRGVCTKFDGEIKQRTTLIKRYNATKDMMEDIWRAIDD